MAGIVGGSQPQTTDEYGKGWQPRKETPKANSLWAIQVVKGSRNKYTDLKQSFLRVFNDLNPTEDCEHLMEWARECERPAGYLPPGPLAQTGDDRGLDR